MHNPKSTRRALFAATTGVIALTIGLTAWPSAPSLADDATGDPALIQRVRTGLQIDAGPRHRVSVALIENDTVTEAYFGSGDDTEFEIGSLTKTFTGDLLADSITRGEVTARTRLGEIFDLDDSQAAAVTLEELATHTSGLPGVPETAEVLLRSVLLELTANDPYQFGLPALLDQARQAELTAPPSVSYSNFGFALLGQALARAAGMSYPELVRERILTPLGLRATYVPTSVSDLTADAPTGFTASGRPSDPWTLGAYAPAGSIRSTLEDMVTFARAHLDATAPGVNAAEPKLSAGSLGDIGWAWLRSDGITWHNGLTGGFATFVGFDRDSHRAVVILSDTAVSVDGLGFSLMGRDIEEAGQ